MVSTTCILSSCTFQQNGSERPRSFSTKPFTTAHVEPQSLSHISSMVLAMPDWAPEAQNCQGRFDLEKAITSAFDSESATTVIDSAERIGTNTDVSRAIQGAKADAAILVKLIRCEELIGSKYGATQPAQVGFMISVIDKSGKDLWSGTFSMKDQAILDNLLTAREKLKVGTGWVTAEAILNHGLTLAAREFEKDRTRSFIE